MDEDSRVVAREVEVVVAFAGGGVEAGDLVGVAAEDVVYGEVGEPQEDEDGEGDCEPFVWEGLEELGGNNRRGLGLQRRALRGWVKPKKFFVFVCFAIAIILGVSGIPVQGRSRESMKTRIRA